MITYKTLQTARGIEGMDRGASAVHPFAINWTSLKRALERSGRRIENWLSVDTGVHGIVDVCEVTDGIRSEWYLPF